MHQKLHNIVTHKIDEKENNIEDMYKHTKEDTEEAMEQSVNQIIQNSDISHRGKKQGNIKIQQTFGVLT